MSALSPLWIFESDYSVSVRVCVRDVTKFEFEFSIVRSNYIRTSNVFTRLEIQLIFLVLCCRMWICGKILALWLILYAQRDIECRETFFLRFNLSHELQLLNVQCNFCSVICYTVQIWTPILLTFGNNILLQWFNWPKRVHCIPNDKTNASVRIRIRQILKVKIRIRRMGILTSFVTSLVCVCGCVLVNIIKWLLFIDKACFYMLCRVRWYLHISSSHPLHIVYV